MTAIALKHGGTLDQYIGDAIRVFFGDPTYYDDHAERAVQAALEMRSRWAELRSRWVRDGRTELRPQLVDDVAIDFWEVTGARALQYGQGRELDWSYILRRAVADRTLRQRILAEPELYLSTDVVTEADRDYLLGLVALLERPLFAGIDAGEVLALLSLTARRSFPSGTTIAQPESRLGDWQIVVDGNAFVLRHHVDGREVHVSTLEAGDHFGAQPGGGIREERVVRAHSPVTLLVLPLGSMTALAAAAPRLFERIATAIDRPATEGQPTNRAARLAVS